jgi:imidazoleglycerol phosphate dehydratase HisB
MAARVALLDMSAELRGATQLDGAHHAPLDTTEPVGMRLPILLAAAAEDVRHLKRWAHRQLQKYSGC